MKLESRKMRWMSATTLALINVAEAGKALGYGVIRVSQALDRWAERRMLDYARAEGEKRRAPPSQNELQDAQHGGPS